MSRVLLALVLVVYWVTVGVLLLGNSNSPGVEEDSNNPWPG